MLRFIIVLFVYLMPLEGVGQGSKIDDVNAAAFQEELTRIMESIAGVKHMQVCDFLFIILMPISTTKQCYYSDIFIHVFLYITLFYVHVYIWMSLAVEHYIYYHVCYQVLMFI